MDTKKQMKKMHEYAKSKNADPRELFAMLRENSAMLQNAFWGETAVQVTENEENDTPAKRTAQIIWKICQSGIEKNHDIKQLFLSRNAYGSPCIHVKEAENKSKVIDVFDSFAPSTDDALNEFRELEAIWGEEMLNSNAHFFADAVCKELAVLVSDYCGTDISVEYT